MLATRAIPDPSPLQGGRRPQNSGVLLRVVPDRLATPLRRAHATEHVARGQERIPAFRLTRSLIAGARFAGCTDAAVAECLGISLNAVRTRGGSDGWIAVAEFAELTDLTSKTIELWARDGLLPHTATDDYGRRYYAASNLMRALTRVDSAGPDLV